MSQPQKFAKIDSNWIPQKLKEVHTRTFGEHILVINPRVPAWIVTNKNGLFLLRMADGKSTIQQIYYLTAQCRPSTTLAEVETFFQQIASKLYIDSNDQFPEYLSNADSWAKRKLGALYLHLTNKCNLQCSYCYRESSPFIPTRRTTKEICFALRKFLSHVTPGCELTFSGGEPLVHKGFEDIARFSSKLGYENRLLTNGILIDERRADFIAKYFRNGKISLDSPNEFENSEFRGKNFAKVVRAIHLLHDRNFDLEVQVTVGQTNLESCRKIRDVLPENQKIKFTPILPMGRGVSKSDEFISNDEFGKLNSDVSEGKISNNYNQGMPVRGCYAGSFSVSVADNGDLYPCHLFHYPEYKIGNVYEDNLDDVLYSEELKEYVVNMDVENNNTNCKKCGVRFLCGGGCKANTLHATGSMFGVDLHCSYLRSTITKDLYLQSVGGEAGASPA